MNNKSKFNIIAGLAMIFLFVTSCDTEKEDVSEKGDEIQSRIVAMSFCEPRS